MEKANEHSKSESKNALPVDVSKRNSQFLLAKFPVQ